MASSVTFRLCRNVLRNVVSSRFVASYGPCSLSRWVFDTKINLIDDHPRVVRLMDRQLHTSVVCLKKKPKKGKPVQEEESDSDDEASDKEEGGEDEFARDYRLVDCPVSAMRLDSVAKVALAIPRAMVETLMLEGKIRVDGQLCRKKAALVDIGTTIDYLLEASPDNPDFTLVRRIMVHKISDKTDNQGRIIVTVKKWAQLTVDDYKLSSAASDKGSE